jgi:pyruvate dehydrogenase E2 component (dihydrolipoamide acetyltransferase)
MSNVFHMPSLGADMEAGTLIEWTKQPGEPLKKGDTIAVIETQKGAIEVEVFHDAVMGRPLIDIGEKVPVGAPMAELEPLEPDTPSARPAETRAPGKAATVAGRQGEQQTSEARPQPSTASEAAARAPQPQAPEPTAAAERHRASPAARRLAEQRGVELTAIEGTGPGGAVTLADVKAASGQPQPAPQQKPKPKPNSKRTQGKPDLAAMRQAIAAAMSRSKREIPHYYLAHDIDLTSAADWLTRRNAERPPDKRLLLGVLFIKAVALTLRDFQELNGFDRDGRFEAAEAIHVGTATAIRGGGLVAPAIHHADQLHLDALMARLRDLITRVRRGGLKASELSDPTVTVSSLGERGVDRLYGVIYPPQVAIIGFGSPRTRPWVVDGDVQPRSVVTATLAADHRHSDGHRGALFLARLAARLQEPDAL